MKDECEVIPALANYWPADDPDFDGFSNAHEYLMGTHPRDAGSHPSAPALRLVAAEPTRLVLEPGFGEIPAGARVELQSSASLAEDDWSPFAFRDPGQAWELLDGVTLDEPGRLILPLEATGEPAFFRCLIHIETP